MFFFKKKENNNEKYYLKHLNYLDYLKINNNISLIIYIYY